jgi:hypothetical protein
MKHTPSRWWDLRARATQSPFDLLSKRAVAQPIQFNHDAWQLKQGVKNVVKAILDETPKIGKKALKVLWRMFKGDGLFTHPKFHGLWRDLKFVCKVKLSVILQLVKAGFIERVYDTSWTLTRAGRAAAV